MAKAGDMDLKKKAALVNKKLKVLHKDARIELEYSNPLELLVAVILSAQCTDVRVNIVSKDLFQKYKRPDDYLLRPAEELENDIKSTGFFRQKTKSIRGAMKAIIEEYGGKVPDDMDKLTKLPGVGRKTANVILANAYGKPGIAVDTHVKRISGRIGLTKQSDPVKIEYDLNDLYPKKEWGQLSHTLIFHGRYICKARKPLCDKCNITDLCNYYRKEQTQ